MSVRIDLVALACLCAAAAAGQEDFADPAECLRLRSGAQQPLADCVHEIHAPCFQYPPASAAGTACFGQAKQRWGDLIAARMQHIRDRAPPQIAEIAGIEVKYDLRGNLLQCDRLAELALVARDPDDGTLHARARCEATAVGLAYAKLWLQSHRFD